jgi:hypothetical protein
MGRRGRSSSSGFRINGYSGLCASFANPGKGPVDMRIRFYMNRKIVGARIKECLQEPFGMFNHEMDVKHLRRIPFPQG